MDAPTSDAILVPEDLLDHHGLDVEDLRAVLAELTDRVRAEVAGVVEERDDRAGVIPVVEAGEPFRLSDAERERIRRRGCVIVRNTFERAEAEAWDGEIGRYLERNRFADRFAAVYPDAAEDGSRIWGIYWSRPQVAARQHPRMAAVRAVLNSVWRHESGGRTWFDPGLDIGYPDRLRRRAPGVRARGLRPHVDAASTAGWRSAENQRVFAAVLDGAIDRYDPWDGAHRTTPAPADAAPSSVFRTFQGWTALSEMRPDDGGLSIVPIPAAVAYLLVVGLAGELGVHGEPTPAPARLTIDEVIAPALTPIPVVEPGDTVWWHGDLVHAVAEAANDVRWGNVMYIGAAPACARNDRYAATMRERFERGASPVDFPAEDFEVDFTGRATVADLNDLGRRQFGLDAGERLGTG